MTSEKTKRYDEVHRQIKSLGIKPTKRLTTTIATKITLAAQNQDDSEELGAISVGGSSVRDWIRLELCDRGYFKIGGLTTRRLVIGIFHFWPWDIERYGPQPTEYCGSNIDTTARSPIPRLAHKSPMDIVAWRVGGFVGSKKS